jgi:hypothetical protein
MFNLYKSSSLDSCDCKLNFDVQLDIPELRIPPPPPPGMIEEMFKDDIEINEIE